MDFKEKLKKIFKNERRRLKDEIQRVWDEMQNYKPGTVKYKQLKEDYDDLMDRETELIKFEKDIQKVVVASGVGMVLVLLYQWVCEHANNPFTREITKLLMKLTGTHV